MDYLLLAVALVLLGASALTLRSFAKPATPKGRKPVNLSRFFTPVLSPLYSLVVLAIVGALVYACGRWPDLLNLLRLVLLNRYALLAGALLIGLVPLAMGVFPGLLRSLFVLQRPSHLFNVTWLSLLAAEMVLITTRVAEYNAGARYDGCHATLGSTLDPIRVGLRYLLLLLFGLPIPYACFRCSVLNLKEYARVRFWIHIALGTAAGLGLVFVSGLVRGMLLAPDVQLQGLFPAAEWVAPHLPHTPVLFGAGEALADFAAYFGRGYTQRLESGTLALAPGHADVLLGMTVAAAVYLLSYAWVLVTRKTPTENFWFPPLFFALLVVILVGFVLQSLAFWLDLYHIPVSLAVVGVSALLFFVNRTDHFFDLMNRGGGGRRRPAPAGAPTHRPTPAAPPAAAAPGPALAALSLDRAAAAWRLPPRSFVKEESGKKTLVVVTAAGGGIQASAWAARVLVGLHARYGDAFSTSIGLISAVSGGSVGAMYYLDQWKNRTTSFDAQALGADTTWPTGSILWNSVQSSLDATGWGLAFPDLLRTFFPPLAFRTDDRGARIEAAWRTRMKFPDDRFKDWGDHMAVGEMPIVVFNATVVETGQRMLASPVLKRRPGIDPAPDSTQARELLDLYPTADPLVSTAVRLSATFPYVSPICRPLEGASRSTADDYHFCDGGYVDNEGMVTVIDWLRALLNPNYLDPNVRRTLFDQILIIRISPFPTDTQAPPAVANRGWFYATVGPLDAMQHVRVTSQPERNNIAVGLFADAAWQQGVPVKSALFVFRPGPNAGPTPLSWMLTEQQKQNIDVAWQDLVASSAEGNPPPEDPFGVVDKIFRPPLPVA